jgi:hypothetical protein
MAWPFDIFSGDSATPAPAALDPMQVYQRERDQARTNALMMGGLGLLEAGGPSPYPVGIGQAISRGGMAGIGGYQRGMNNAYRGAGFASQMGDWQRKQRQQNRLDAARDAMVAEMTGQPAPAVARVPGESISIGDLGDAGTTMPLAQAAGAGDHAASPDAPEGFGRGTSTLPLIDRPARIGSAFDNMSAAPAAPSRSAYAAPAGMPPAMWNYLLESSPQAAASMMVRDNKPIAVAQDAGLYVPGQGWIREPGAAKPIIRDFNIGDRTETRQSFDNGRTWQPMEGVGGPRWNPTERGAAPTLAQQANNQEILAARRRLADEMQSKGLTQQQLAAMSQQFDQRGLSNPAFNPVIARMFNNALQRLTDKEDPGFEGAWSMFVGQRAPSGAPGEIGTREGFLTEHLGPNISSVTGAGPGTLGGPVDLPKTAAGKTDAMRLKNGQTYRLGDGSFARYDATQRAFVPVD